MYDFGVGRVRRPVRRRGQWVSRIERAQAAEAYATVPFDRADKARQPGFVRDLFNATATDYDSVNRIFSLGSGAWYRRRCLKRAGLRPGLKIADIAIGTGLIAREAIRLTGDTRDVIGIDLSEGMLSEARQNLGVAVVQGQAEALPLANESVDFVAMGFALRHVSDFAATFGEFWRVLRPGGTVLILETIRPRHAFYRAFAYFYLSRLVPLACRTASAARNARLLLEHCWETTEAFMPTAAIAQAMKDCGFVDIRSGAHFDLFQNHVGFKR